MLTKKDFQGLADMIRDYHHVIEEGTGEIPFAPSQLRLLADFLLQNNPNFDRERWLKYIREGK